MHCGNQITPYNKNCHMLSDVVANMCRDCGIIVGPEASAPPAVAALTTETASRRPPVTGSVALVSMPISL